MAGSSLCRIKPGSPPSTVTHLGWHILPRVHPCERRSLLSAQSRHVIAACWWEVAEAAASNCRIRPTSPPSTLTRLGRAILPRTQAREEAFFQPFSTKSRYVVAVCWWEVAKAATSNCRTKTIPPPSSLTRLGRQILPRVHPGERRRRLSAFLTQNPV